MTASERREREEWILTTKEEEENCIRECHVASRFFACLSSRHEMRFNHVYLMPLVSPPSFVMCGFPFTIPQAHVVLFPSLLPPSLSTTIQEEEEEEEEESECVLEPIAFNSCVSSCCVFSNHPSGNCYAATTSFSLVTHFQSDT